MRAIHCTRGRRGKMRNEVTTVEPTPAAASSAWPGGGGGVGFRMSSISFVEVDAGMMRGRFSGLEKKAKTRERGKGTHCSNKRWLDMQSVQAYINRRTCYVLREGSFTTGDTEEHRGLRGRIQRESIFISLLSFLCSLLFFR